MNTHKVAGEMMEVGSKEGDTRQQQAKTGVVVKHEWGRLEAEMVEGADTMSAPQERKQMIAERLSEAGVYSKSAVQAMGSASAPARGHDSLAVPSDECKKPKYLIHYLKIYH